jgi:hypothetical protein
MAAIGQALSFDPEIFRVTPSRPSPRLKKGGSGAARFGPDGYSTLKHAPQQYGLRDARIAANNFPLPSDRGFAWRKVRSGGHQLSRGREGLGKLVAEFAWRN